MGDMNLDEQMKYLNEYCHKASYDVQIDTFDDLGLFQLVNFMTWSRLLNIIWRKLQWKNRCGFSWIYFTQKYLTILA